MEHIECLLSPYTLLSVSREPCLRGKYGSLEKDRGIEGVLWKICPKLQRRPHSWVCYNPPLDSAPL